MPEGLCPVHWAGRQAVVALPEHIDVSNAAQIREELLWVINRGAAALIADMTATISCDHAGADAVVRAYQRAVISGTELRLVVTAPVVLRVLSLSGVHRLASIYPSLEAAAAAQAPAAVHAQAPGPDGPGTNGQAPARRGGRTSAQFRAAGLPDKSGAAIAPAVVWELLDALQDGVALADGDGMIALANRRLEEMFGYEHGKLIGRAAESLIPAGLLAAHSHEVTDARGPRTRPAGAGARLAGLRKDGTTFPAKITLSPVTTPAGHYTLTVTPEITKARHLEDLTDLAGATVMGEQAQSSRELLDTIISRLFSVALTLQEAMELPAEATRQRITEALGHLDDTIREIRDSAFTTRDHDISPHPHHPNGAR
jgi:anti-anti-sigma factor